MSANSSPWRRARRAVAVTVGTSSRTSSSAAAMCIAVGNVSFDDCDMFTSSFGWTGFLDPRSPPASSIARFAITSLTFMFVCVPLPVCHTDSGNSSSSLPAMISSAACTMTSAFSAGSLPRSGSPARRPSSGSPCPGSPRRASGRRRWRSDGCERWRLGAPVVLGGHVDRAHAVGFGCACSCSERTPLFAHFAYRAVHRDAEVRTRAAPQRA